MEKVEVIKADFDWVKVGGRYFSEAFMVASDTVSDIGDKVECSYNARISKEELSVWIWNKLTATATRREDGIWKQPSGSANPKASSNALQVRPLLVVSFRESFTPAMSEVFKRNTKGIEERCWWVVVAVDCQDEAKVQAFAPGLPDINAMDTDEAITMLEALLEGLKRGRGDGGG